MYYFCITLSKIVLKSLSYEKYKADLFLLAEEPAEAALDALLLLGGGYGRGRGRAHGRLHVEVVGPGVLADRQAAGEIVLVQAVLAAVSRGQWGRSPRIECPVVMLPMPVSHGTLI